MTILEKIDKYLQEQSAEYKAFFEKKLKEYGVSSPAELSDEDKKKFFNEIDKEWKGEKESD